MLPCGPLVWAWGGKLHSMWCPMDSGPCPHDGESVRNTDIRGPEGWAWPGCTILMYTPSVLVTIWLQQPLHSGFFWTLELKELSTLKCMEWVVGPEVWWLQSRTSWLQRKCAFSAVRLGRGCSWSLDAFSVTSPCDSSPWPVFSCVGNWK